MSTTTTRPPAFLSVEDAAAELGVPSRLIWHWHAAGLLAVFADNEAAMRGTRGRKKGRIALAEWARFKLARTVTVQPKRDGATPGGPGRGRPRNDAPKPDPDDPIGVGWRKAKR